MIEQTITDQAQAFANFWSAIFADYPYYQLDFTWPSIGVVDRLLSPLREKERLTEFENLMLEGTASYLAKMIHDCWNNFDQELDVRAFLNTASPNGPIIEASGGKYLTSDTSFRVPLQRTLQRLFRQSSSSEVPSFGRHKRFVTETDNLLSTFATGLFTGLCPWGEGPWSTHAEEKFADYIKSTVTFLSRSSGLCYQRTSLLEELGASPSLYASNLILPPAFAYEPYRALRAVSGVVDFWRTTHTEEDRLRKLVHQLAHSMDELIASAGFAIACAFESERPSDKLKSLSFAFEKNISALRPAVMLARLTLRRPDNWISLLEQEKYDEATKLYVLENELGLLPLLSVNEETLANKRLIIFFQLASWQRLPEARQYLESVLASSQPSVSLLLQYGHLSLLLNKRKDAEETLKKLHASKTENDEDSFHLSILRAEYCRRYGTTEEAAGYYGRAIRTKAALGLREVCETNWLCRYLLSSKRPQEALKIAEQLLVQQPAAVPVRLAKVDALFAINETDQAENELNELYQLCPNNYQSFERIRDYLTLKRTAGSSSN